TQQIHSPTEPRSQQAPGEICGGEAVWDPGQSRCETEQRRAKSGRRHSFDQDRGSLIAQAEGESLGESSRPALGQPGESARGSARGVVFGPERCAQRVRGKDGVFGSGVGWERRGSSRWVLAVQRNGGRGARQRNYALVSNPVFGACPGFRQRERRDFGCRGPGPSAHRGSRHLGHGSGRGSEKAVGAAAGAARTLCHPLRGTAFGDQPTAPEGDDSPSGRLLPPPLSGAGDQAREGARESLRTSLWRRTVSLAGPGRKVTAGRGGRFRTRADAVADQSVRSAGLAIAMVDRANLSNAVEN